MERNKKTILLKRTDINHNNNNNNFSFTKNRRPTSLSSLSRATTYNNNNNQCVLFVLLLALVLFLGVYYVFFIIDSWSQIIMTDQMTTTMTSTMTMTTRRWDNSHYYNNNNVVIGLAVGYGLDVYQRFVGSLRATGYPGQIILGIALDTSHDIMTYLTENNVTTEIVEFGPCTYYTTDKDKKSIQCAKAYPEYKITWGRFALARDWLRHLGCPKNDNNDDCTTTTTSSNSSGVMLTDVRDVFFQRDPFEAIILDEQQEEEPAQLLVFEEHFNQTTEHWLTDFPLQKCRNYIFGPQPMLCSGSIMGSRWAILEYIKVMMHEFDYWNAHAEQCLTDLIGDDQSIHNYVYYTLQLKDLAVFAVPHRTGPIHVVGYEADIIHRTEIQKALDAGHGKDLMEAENWINHHGLNWNNTNINNNNGETTTTTTLPRNNWLPLEYNLTDAKTGMILNLDGSPSPQVHQYDRFGLAFEKFWLNPMQTHVWSSSDLPSPEP